MIKIINAVKSLEEMGVWFTISIGRGDAGKLPGMISDSAFIRGATIHISGKGLHIALKIRSLDLQNDTFLFPLERIEDLEMLLDNQRTFERVAVPVIKEKNMLATKQRVENTRKINPMWKKGSCSGHKRKIPQRKIYELRTTGPNASSMELGARKAIDLRFCYNEMLPPEEQIIEYAKKVEAITTAESLPSCIVFCISKPWWISTGQVSIPIRELGAGLSFLRCNSPELQEVVLDETA